VAKNVILAGMNVVIQDSSLLQVSDLSYAFCSTADQVGTNVSLFIVIIIISLEL
jgi:hypothetical protein